MQPPFPAFAYDLQGLDGGAGAIGQDFVARMLGVVVVFAFTHRQLAPQELLDLVEQAQLVACGELDVDSLDGISIFTHACQRNHDRSEEHTSELQSLMRISYA